MLRILIVVLVLACAATAQTDLKQPFQVKAGDKVIDVTIGHAAPSFVDFDGDGLKDLLVGQFGEGQLRVYRNVGTKGAPAFEAFKLFQAGGANGTVPSG